MTNPTTTDPTTHQQTDNRAAWLPSSKARLHVAPAPCAPPGAGEILVANRAVAVNPVDWIKQVLGGAMFPWMRYPFVLGSDLAGEVVDVGPGVTRFQVGDRVLAHAVWTDKKRNRPGAGAFQERTVVWAHMAAPIPAAMTYERAAVLPLGLSTAACALFQTDQLALQHPSAHPRPTGQTLLVWGGSTSVGSNAIQLAVAAGYQVVTTAAPHNADHARGLGASEVFDHHSPTVVADVIAALAGRTIAGALAVGTGSGRACVDIVAACQGSRFVAMASPSVSFAAGLSAPLVARMVSSSAALAVRAARCRVRTRFISGSSLVDDEVSRLVYEDFLPAALAEGRFTPAPDPRVIGTGLEHIQAGLDVHRAGVSAQKIVISL